MPTSKSAVVIEDRIMVPRAALDHGGYRDWVKSDDYPERLRTTFIAGEVLVEMTPESIEAHNKIKTAIASALAAFVETQDLGEVFSDGTLVTNEEAGLSCEPDFSFVSWASFASGQVSLVQRVAGEDYVEVLGGPDLVVEIISDSSVRKDTQLLREAYFRAGVREYWLFDARKADLRFEILVRGAQGFLAPLDPTGPQPSGVLGGHWVLTRTRNRVGRFAYRLNRME